MQCGCGNTFAAGPEQKLLDAIFDEGMVCNDCVEEQEREEDRDQIRVNGMTLEDYLAFGG